MVRVIVIVISLVSVLVAILILIILIGLALNQYFNSRLSNLLFKNTCKYLYSFFKGPSLEHKNFSKWNIILLKTIIDKNINKLTNNCL